MSNNNQTVADIVREMRTLGRLDEKSTDKIPRTLQALGLRTYADRLDAAIRREKRKPVRILECFATEKDAHEAFIKFCDNRICKECRFGNRMKRSGCAIAWLYEEVGKEDEK